MDTSGQIYARDICVVYICVLRLPFDKYIFFPIGTKEVAKEEST